MKYSKVGGILSVSNEKVKLDEVLKFLFSTSKKVLVNLLNGIFKENFDTDEVELSVSNNEFRHMKENNRFKML
ncbi:hypothetical protein [Clostridium weizhouense]|uniref:Uncharacterized protein n=1 Tax=Clostridium weizhouense TaxID=2859781 RepID=A0ABS7ASC0_9CLOT|nr:hypothetical protein [Clostridium weizhouense]MBW6411564.1 hypothetical protein [Clostridium weizhouense]